MNLLQLHSCFWNLQSNEAQLDVNMLGLLMVCLIFAVSNQLSESSARSWDFLVGWFSIKIQNFRSPEEDTCTSSHQYSKSLAWITSMELVQPVYCTCLLVLSGGRGVKGGRILNQRKEREMLLYLGPCFFVTTHFCVTGCRIIWFIVLCVWNIESEIGCWVPCKPLSNEESLAYTLHSLSVRPQNFTMLELFHCC